MDDSLFDFLFEGGPINTALYEELFGQILGGRSGQPEKKVEEMSEGEFRQLVKKAVVDAMLTEEVGKAFTLYTAIGVKLFWQATASMVLDAATWPIRAFGSIITWPFKTAAHFIIAAYDWQGAQASIAVHDTMPSEVRRLMNARGYDITVAHGVRAGMRFGRWLNNYFFPQDVEEDDGEYESEEGNDGEGDDPQNDDGLGDAV